MTAWVYLVRCGDGSLYCGATTNLVRRMGCHQRGQGAKYIRARGFSGLAAQWQVNSYPAALRLECWLKTKSKPKKEAWVREPAQFWQAVEQTNVTAGLSGLGRD
ncbi:GIY-YIG nuclease family protein [Candidatus Cyanaurora vandensis]|uniref:GIY-YIG nuclease family protein n=1 Tax=Candidatus Cyanaurora vandensis TaxID=2714958 RepID=UPI00257EE291|nr:GIY-YIG nuclease family protein [Candidatus Cyanaurora vandensis]